MKTINENSRLPVIFRLFNAAIASATPTTLRYRVDCETTKKTLLDWTSLTPSATATVTVPASLNAIQNRANGYEIKSMTVEADNGTDDAFSDSFTWRVNNLFGIR